MKKIFLCMVAGFFLVSAATASAHVVVKPGEVKAGAFQTFTVGVPVEKDIPTTGVRLSIPDGLQHVTPNVKPGWRITVKKEGTGEAAKITEIFWTGGSIPAGQRDEFLFSAQAPATETILNWKAYQTYQDGSIVSWDAESGETPYSKTTVVNDLAASPAAAPSQGNSSTALTFSILAFVLALVAITRTRHNPHQNF